MCLAILCHFPCLVRDDNQMISLETKHFAQKTQHQHSFFATEKIACGLWCYRVTPNLDDVSRLYEDVLRNGLFSVLLWVLLSPRHHGAVIAHSSRRCNLGWNFQMFLKIILPTSICILPSKSSGKIICLGFSCNLIPLIDVYFTWGWLSSEFDLSFIDSVFWRLWLLGTFLMELPFSSVTRESSSSV